MELPDGSQFIRRREYQFARHFVFGLCDMLPVLDECSQRRLQQLLLALAMDAIPLAGYRIRSELLLKKQASYLVNMPRVQAEIERHMADRGLGMDQIAKTLADIMNGDATVTTKEYDGEGALKSKTVAQPSISDRLRAIDLRVRATTGYAPTTSKVASLHMNANTMYTPDEFRSTPAIHVDPQLALEDEKNLEHEPMFDEDDHPDNCECEECGEFEDDDEDDEE